MNGTNIFAAIAGVMTDIQPIAKNKKNTQQGFLYRGVDEVMNELQPLLAKWKVFIVPEVLESARHERASKSGGVLFCVIQKVKFTFYADDGSSFYAIVEGEAMDSADKGTNKALSVAFKYACFQVFCIPTDDAKDPDRESPEPRAVVQNGISNDRGTWVPDAKTTEKPVDVEALKVDMNKMKTALVTIVTSVDESMLPYFTDDELAEAREELKKLTYTEDSKKHLSGLKAKYENILAQKKELNGVPFGDDKTK